MNRDHIFMFIDLTMRTEDEVFGPENMRTVT